MDVKKPGNTIALLFYAANTIALLFYAAAAAKGVRALLVSYERGILCRVLFTIKLILLYSMECAIRSCCSLMEIFDCYGTFPLSKSSFVNVC